MKHSLRRHLKLYFICLRTIINGEMAYRLNFIFGTIMTFCGNILFPLVTILIYANGQSFPNWSFWQVLLIQGVFTLSTGISSTFLDGIFWGLNRCIKEGSLDVALLKPVSLLFYLAATNVDIQAVSFIIGGIIMICVSAPHCAAVTLGGVLNFIVLFLAGTLILFSTTLIMSATAFKWVGNSRIPEIFDSVYQVGKYPISVFPKAIQTVSTFVFPIAMVAFIPSQALMGNMQSQYYWALIPCVALCVFSVLLFNYMVHLYESVGG